jgi:hypothetical protein
VRRAVNEARAYKRAGGMLAIQEPILEGFKRSRETHEEVLVGLRAGQRVHHANKILEASEIGSSLTRAVNHTLSSFDLFARRTNEDSRMADAAAAIKDAAGEIGPVVNVSADRMIADMINEHLQRALPNAPLAPPVRKSVDVEAEVKVGVRRAMQAA